MKGETDEGEVKRRQNLVEVRKAESENVSAW